MHPFGGVIFDIDGVLCDSEPFTAEAGCRMFAEVHRITVQPEDFRPFVGAGEDRYIGGVAEKYRLHIDLPRSKERMYAIYLEIIKGRLPPLPGAVEFVAWLRGRGMKLAVATSADTVKMEGNLREIGLPPEQFDACISGTEVRRKKPNPDIFLRAAERLGLPSARFLVVEDAPNGVKAAKAAGSRCLALTTSFDQSTLRDAGADWTAPDFAQVPHSIFGG